MQNQNSNFLYHKHLSPKEMEDFQACAKHWARHQVNGGRKMPELRFQRGRKRHTIQGPKFQAGASRLRHLEICLAVRDGGRGEVFLLSSDLPTFFY